MTSTWNRNLETSTTGVDDTYYGSFRGGRSYYWNHRDAQGRFVRATHVDQLTVDALPMWNAGPFGHANERCAASHGTPVATDHAGAKFLCPTCVHVPCVDPFAGPASKDGHMTCAMCERERPVTKFPTKTVHGVTVRHDVCRECRDASVVHRDRRAPWQR